MVVGSLRRKMPAGFLLLLIAAAPDSGQLARAVHAGNRQLGGTWDAARGALVCFVVLFVW